jgi:sterol desaturase/sphingolipid hydroxylase (fatty acid hydroxylase superfamily)
MGAGMSVAEKLRPAHRMKTDWQWFLLGLGGQTVMLVSIVYCSVFHVAVAEYLRRHATGPAGLVFSGPAILLIPLHVLVAEFVVYWGHRAMHTRLLWRVHRWHHHVEQLSWWSGAFGSPVHHLITSAPTIASLALFDLTQAQATGVALFAFFTQCQIHSNLRVDLPALLGPLGPLGRAVEWIYVLPQTHRIHHAVEERLHDRNLCFVLTIWDRLFGTYQDPRAVDFGYPIGLPESEREIHHAQMALGL